jgi:hypothetical protein
VEGEQKTSNQNRNRKPRNKNNQGKANEAGKEGAMLEESKDEPRP